MSHTPEPWCIKETVGDLVNSKEVFSETRDEIALVLIDDTDVDSLAETEANGRLIKSSPRLLEACRNILNRLDYLRNLWGDEGVTRSLCDEVRAAVKEATGGDR